MESCLPHLEVWDWAQSVVRFTTRIPPLRVVQSVRAIAWNSSDEVTVCESDLGEFFLPGGTREPGESPDNCLRRELMEEAGLELRGEPRWFAAHVGVSYHDNPYRSYAPFPLKAWLWATVATEQVCAPSNPPGAEQVAAVRFLPPLEAIELLSGTGRGYTTALSEAVNGIARERSERGHG